MYHTTTKNLNPATALTYTTALAATLEACDIYLCRTLAQERYASLRETVLTDEWFARELENLQHTVVDSGAFERDRARWPEGNHEGDYASLSAYTQKRLAWLDAFMSDIEAGLKNWE